MLLRPPALLIRDVIAESNLSFALYFLWAEFRIVRQRGDDFWVRG